ncbi:MAG TPA: hypothetical protein DEO84_05645 [candidate division Zixibacteria bacterium]|jgi:hypothetical protein|nr:hypothetical protein [candidate division Zixibacteria bacterium]HBZ00790.1 hypothetical protein [candidate division Zixibacteria bacterium]
MKKSQCFVDEAELCLYIDNEIDEFRRAALVEHIEICDVCAQELAAWKKLRLLVRDALITSKAPYHLADNIRHGLTAVASIRDPIILPEDTGDFPWPRIQFQQSAYLIRSDFAQWN